MTWTYATDQCGKCPSQPHAEWVANEHGVEPFCSNCLTFAIEDKAGDFAMTNFCPECGARMDGIKGEYAWRPINSTSIGNTVSLKYEQQRVSATASLT